MKFRIYRYNPETDANRPCRDFDLDFEAGDAMLLDALVHAQGTGRQPWFSPVLP